MVVRGDLLLLYIIYSYILLSESGYTGFSGQGGSYCVSPVRPCGGSSSLANWGLYSNDRIFPCTSCPLPQKEGRKVFYHIKYTTISNYYEIFILFNITFSGTYGRGGECITFMDFSNKTEFIYNHQEKGNKISVQDDNLIWCSDIGSCPFGGQLPICATWWALLYLCVYVCQSAGRLYLRTPYY